MVTDASAELAEMLPYGSEAAVGALSLVSRYAARMATWWELAIPVGGTLLGVLIGTWGQARNNARLLKLQSVMEEKRKQYYEFLTLIEEWENLGGGFPDIPLTELPEEEVRTINAAANEVFDSYTRMQFIASPEAMEVVEEFYLMVRDNRRFNADLLNHFVKVARKDLGVGGKVPSTWRIDRKLRKLSIESDDS